MAALARPVVMHWQMSSYFGWGVIGIHFMTNWALQQREPLLTTMPVLASALDINPLEAALIEPSIGKSRQLQAQLEPYGGQAVNLTIPVMHALGNDFSVAGNAQNVRITGSPSIALPVFESSNLSAEHRERLKAYPCIVAASTWNAEVLAAADVGPIALALQGVDPTAFHPAPKAGWFAGRFAIFSGGKLEYRKGQDLVLRAFAAFARRHPEALLVTAWVSPWPNFARSFGIDLSIPPVPFKADGTLDVTAWAAVYGIASDAIFDLGKQSNGAMARIYREMDVGLFPNRCEGGTNLVAMECMACGVPVILSSNTGHLDLIAPDRCFALERQAPIGAAEFGGWGESDVEEVVETLEFVYRDSAERSERGARGAAFMQSMTWADTVRRLTEIIEPYV